MAINPNILLQGRGANVPFVDLGAIRDRSQANEQARTIGDLQVKQHERQAEEFERNAPTRKLEDFNSRDRARIISIVTGAHEVLPFVEGGDFDAADKLLNQRRRALNDAGLPTNDTDEFQQLIRSDPELALKQARDAVEIGIAQRILKDPEAPKGFTLSQGQTRFDAQGNPVASVDPKQASAQSPIGKLQSDLNAEIIDKPTFDAAVRARNSQKTGLFSAKTEILGDGTSIFAGPNGKTRVLNPEGEEVFGDERLAVLKTAQQAEIDRARTKKGAEAAGASAIKQSDAAIEQLGKIKTSIENIDRGIAALDKGANPGPFMSRLPTIQAASIELDNVRSSLGLDVVGAVTFGALSEGELELALNTALPVGLEPEALREWLVNKKTALTKFSDYLKDAAIFLGTPGNTPAKWIEAQQEVQGGTVMNFDAQGNLIQ